jgi:hypothetical protein
MSRNAGPVGRDLAGRSARLPDHVAPTGRWRRSPWARRGNGAGRGPGHARRPRSASMTAWTSGRSHHLVGPAYVGPGSTLLGGPFTAVSIGPRCKVHGEMEESVVLGYSNKAHDGFLGHAYVGHVGQPGRADHQQRPQEQLRHGPGLDPGRRGGHGRDQGGLLPGRPREDRHRDHDQHRHRGGGGRQRVRRDAAQVCAALQLGRRRRRPTRRPRSWRPPARSCPVGTWSSPTASGAAGGAWAARPGSAP